jgi:cysteine desulfuration protein SufE
MVRPSIEEIQNEIIEEFALFDDWTDRYEYIIDLGKKNPTLSEEFKKEENLIKGCQSQVWLHHRYENNILYFSADSDAIITKGLIALVIAVFNEQSPEAIAKAEVNFIAKIGLGEHLSPTRANGLNSMIQKIKHIAANHLA